MDSETIPQPISGLTSTVSHPNNHSQHANNSPSSGSSYRNNEVRSVMLYGIPIIALVMDAQERLCLAQISNTLLKSFSYNEIHNRRVALGITCVQCTPVQLELLRRAGAMPVSSRRCGMITKREAERLCKSFLAETAPPKLPDSFSFDVYHQCAWGCRGSFTPSRYNSSRAKCIKCVYCGLFFSPNKFIFHSHRLPDSKYIQPDAANFNSWRRHIKLVGSPEPPDDVSYAWEDVKAMFNGGSRKRAMAASLSSCSRGNGSSHQEFLKRQSMNSSSPESTQSLTPNTTMSDSLSPKSTTSAGPTYFPLIPLPNKCYSLPSTNAFGSNPAMTPSSPMKALSTGHSSDFRQSFAEFMWVGSGKPPALHIPYSCLLWPRPPTSSLEFGASDANRSKLLFGSSDSNAFMFPHQQREPHWPQDSLNDRINDRINDRMSDRVNENRESNSNTSMSQTHTSAFKPVAKATIGKVSPNCGNEFETAVRSPENASPSPEPSHTTSEDNDPEVDIIGEDGDDSFTTRKEDNAITFEKQICVQNRKNKNFLISETEVNSDRKRTKFESVNRQEDMGLNFVGQLSDKIEGSIEGRNSKSPALTMCSTALDLRNLTTLSREELHQILIKQSEARMKTEREYDVMRETLEQQVRKEIVYREEVAKQLHLVRDALYQELDQERKARLTVQYKLKESQEVLQQISCKAVNNSRHSDFDLKSLLHHYNGSHSN